MALPDTTIERYYLYLLNTKAEQTAKKYRQAAEKFLGFLAGSGLSLAKLPPNTLHAFCQHLIHNDGLKAGSASVFGYGAKNFLEWSRNHDGKDALPVMGKLEVRQDGKPMPSVITPTQIKMFIGFASRQREPFRTALLLLPYTGLRASEMVSLSLKDIKRIPSQRGERDHLVFVLDPAHTKGNKARVVPIIDAGVHFLVAYLKSWRAGRPSRWLFPSPYEPYKHISIRNLSLYVEKIRDRIKAPTLSPHSFRRIYLTTLHRSGVDLATISRIAGHASMQTTRDHYLAIEADEIADRVSGIRLVERGDHADRVEAAKRRALDLLGQTRDDRIDIPDVPPNLMDLIDGEDDAAE